MSTFTSWTRDMDVKMNVISGRLLHEGFKKFVCYFKKNILQYVFLLKLLGSWFSFFFSKITRYLFKISKFESYRKMGLLLNNGFVIIVCVLVNTLI